ncbi:MAG: polar amino acid transport system ATP-binding protein [Blastocatellia bacterium]|jgi:ABC-type polar amino acid transport system ATPase subunit|nr:polar amino acid transport system ATP-binding protein [Blastocatellia bacterium]
MLTALNIHKMLGQKQVLANVNASIAPGQITALIGPSGGGKSTFLRTLSFLDPPDSGIIEVDDVNYTFPNKNGNRPFPWPKVTIVFQQLFLWPHLTIRQNISLPGKNSNGHGPGGSVDELIALFDLDEFAGRYPNQVSLGQRQRAAIARALALEPKYLLLDEITSALDVEHVGRLLNHIKALRAKGTGILLVTHLIGFAERAADQILFMESGAIVEAGGPELLSAPKSKRLTEFLSLVGTAG